MAKGVEISVILPVFNEAQNLGPLLDRLDSLKLADGEVIVVDDGSTDGTSEVAEKKGSGSSVIPTISGMEPRSKVASEPPRESGWSSWMVTGSTAQRTSRHC